MLLLVVAACTKYTPQQVSSMNDSMLCTTYNNTAKYHSFKSTYGMDTSTEDLVLNAVIERQLNCEPNHRKCISYGAQEGTSNYTDCRLHLDQLDAQEKQVRALAQSIEDAAETTQNINIHKKITVEHR
jgi:hypothetical protein